MSLRPTGNKTGEKERRALVVEYGEDDEDSHPADEGVLPQYKTRPSAGTESNCTYYCMTRGMNNSSCLYHFSIYFSHFQCIYCAAHFLLSVSSSCHHSLLSSVPIHNLNAPPRFLVDSVQSFHFFCSTTSIRAVACFLLLFFCSSLSFSQINLFFSQKIGIRNGNISVVCWSITFLLISPNKLSLFVFLFKKS